jgi:hypothetical protein
MLAVCRVSNLSHKKLISNVFLQSDQKPSMPCSPLFETVYDVYFSKGRFGGWPKSGKIAEEDLYGGVSRCNWDWLKLRIKCVYKIIIKRMNICNIRQKYTSLHLNLLSLQQRAHRTIEVTWYSRPNNRQSGYGKLKVLGSRVFYLLQEFACWPRTLFMFGHIGPTKANAARTSSHAAEWVTADALSWRAWRDWKMQR